MIMDGRPLLASLALASEVSSSHKSRLPVVFTLETRGCHVQPLSFSNSSFNRIEKDVYLFILF